MEKLNAKKAPAPFTGSILGSAVGQCHDEGLSEEDVIAAVRWLYHFVDEAKRTGNDKKMAAAVHQAVTQ